MCSFMSLCIYFNRNVDLREYLTEEAQVTEKNTTYDLVANVVHDGKPTEGAYRIHVLHHVGCRQIFLKFPCGINYTQLKLCVFPNQHCGNMVKMMSLPLSYNVSLCLIRELGSGMRCRTCRWQTFSPRWLHCQRPTSRQVLPFILYACVLENINVAEPCLCTFLCNITFI